VIKPFTADTLRDKINKILARAPPRSEPHMSNAGVTDGSVRDRRGRT